MSYIRFDKTQMTNLDVTLHKEILRSNRSGAYASSTIVDCNTRKYHGLLVVPVPELDDENHVLLSSLDATVIQHGAASIWDCTNTTETTSVRAGINTYASISRCKCPPPSIVWEA